MTKEMKMTTTAAARKAATTAPAAAKKRLPRKPAEDTLTDGVVVGQTEDRTWTLKRVAEVPDQSFLTGYVNRTIDGLTDFQIADYALAHKENMLLEGPTGTGKTSFAYAYAAHKGMALYSLSSSAGSDPSQFRGHIVPTEDGGFRWQDGPLTDIMRHGGVLLINEINFLPDRVASDLFGALDKRRKIELVDHDGEVIYAPDATLILGDMNPGYSGTRDLNAALRNRFGIQLVFDYDPKIEAQLVKMPTLIEVCGRIRDAIELGTYDVPVSTNMMIEFERIAVNLSLDFAIRNFANHFQAADRSSIKQVFDLVSDKLEYDYDLLTGKQSIESGDTYDDDWEAAAEDDEVLYTPDELTGLTAAQLNVLAKSSGIAPGIVAGMKKDELYTLLLGKAGGHSYWDDNDTF